MCNLDTTVGEESAVDEWRNYPVGRKNSTQRPVNTATRSLSSEHTIGWSTIEEKMTKHGDGDGKERQNAMADERRTSI